MDRSSFLRKALLGNAAFSTLTGVEMLAFPDAVARFIGLDQPREIRQLGVELLAFAALLTWTATRRHVRPWAAGIFTALDVGWVVATAALLVSRPDLLNTAGTITTVVVALAVADFAVLQVIGIRRLTGGTAERDDGTALTTAETAAGA